MFDEQNLRVLKAIEFEERISKKGLEYKIWKFEEVRFEKVSENNFKKVFSGKQATRPFWGKRKNISIGKYYEGKIIEYKTTVYSTPTNNQLDTIAVVVMNHENGLDVAARALHYYRAFPFDENGNIHKTTMEYNSFINELHNEHLKEYDDGEFDDF